MMQQKIEPWLEAYGEHTGSPIKPPNRKGFVQIPCVRPENHSNGCDDNPSMSVHVGFGSAKCLACGVKLNSRELQKALKKTLGKTRLDPFAFEKPGMSDDSAIMKRGKAAMREQVKANVPSLRTFYSHEFDYRTPEGELYMKVFRRGTGKTKEFCIVTTSDGGDHWWLGIQPDTPNHLFNSQCVRVDRPVVVVEGELKATLFQDWLNREMTTQAPIVVSWRGGAGAVDNTHWSPLIGHRVVLWPDNDQPGINNMAKIRQKLEPTSTILFEVDPTSLPPKWDVADLIEHGANPVEFLREHSQKINRDAREIAA